MKVCEIKSYYDIRSFDWEIITCKINKIRLKAWAWRYQNFRESNPFSPKSRRFQPRETARHMFMMPSFFIMHFFGQILYSKPKHFTVIYYKTMFNNVFNKEKGFSFYIGTVLGKVQRLSNVFSNERKWQLIESLLHSVHKEISKANIINNSEMLHKFILRNNSYMMVKKEKQVYFFISSL